MSGEDVCPDCRNNDPDACARCITDAEGPGRERCMIYADER